MKMEEKDEYFKDFHQKTERNSMNLGDLNGRIGNNNEGIENLLEEVGRQKIKIN